MRKILITFVISALLSTLSCTETNACKVVSYTAIPKDIKLYWKDDANHVLGNIGNLNFWLGSRGEKLRFAMNGGMFKRDYSPLGLYIEKGSTISPLNTNDAKGNFYLKPNGVFYIEKDNKAFISPTHELRPLHHIKYATQSGPMLLISGNIHPAFTAGSSNVQVRNGVGILPDGKVLFAMSKNKVSLYDFANYFKEQGCKQALYLDGFVSRTYLPESNWIQEDGNLGVLIAVNY